MKKRSSSTRKKASPQGAAFLWDESFLWGIMAWKALRQAGLSFELVRASDVRKGCLSRYSLLFVPGGWSSNKLKALGQEGADAVKAFVRDGGNYLGFCGGAGLATLDGIGLLNVKRKPTRLRVPSFSGRISLKTIEAPLWQGIKEPVFHAWWPPQFDVSGKDILVLGSYEKAMPDSFTSDLRVGDIEPVARWEELEKVYGINLDPSRLYGEPSVIQGSFGKGSVLLSLVHFDTPGDPDAEQVLKNLWSSLADSAPSSVVTVEESRSEVSAVAGVFDIIDGLEASVSDLIDFGIRNFLWHWRNPLLLQWRRGIRGLEYNTLQVMIHFIAESHRNGSAKINRSELVRIRKKLIPFLLKTKQLLIRERLTMQQASLSFRDGADDETKRLRSELFSMSKSYGGLFKELIDDIDAVLYKILLLHQPWIC